MNPPLSPEQAKLLVALGRRGNEPFYSFRPLAGSQRKFVEDDSRVQVVLGGNASGKSEVGAFKTAIKVLTTAPPRKGTPFWIISKSYEMVGSVAWGEKLKKYIHPRNIAWQSWINKVRGWPSAIGLKNGWVLEFKSWEQGRDAFQARSIGGAWLDEQFPKDVFMETFARTRDFNSPIWTTLTPIEPDPFLQERYDESPKGWSWFSFNLEDNRASRGGHVSDEWIDAFIAEIPDDFRDVRIHGRFAGFEGAVFKQWRREIHVCSPFPDNIPPSEGIVVRSIDFGFNNPFVCLWLHRDQDGCWTVYDEHYRARELTSHHAERINNRPSPRQNILHTWADPEDAQSRAELAELGIVTDSAHKEKRAGIEELQRLLMVRGNGKPMLHVCSNCVNTIREISLYQWEINSSGRHNAADEPKKKDDHTVDALRYAVFSEKSSGEWLRPDRIGGSSIFASGFKEILE